MITPELVMVATALLSLTHTPPVVGANVVVPPIQMVPAPVTETATLGFTVPVSAVEAQPVEVCVYVKLAVPAEIPVTKPAFVTVATPALLVDHVPPEAGDNCVVKPIHIADGPVKLTTGMMFTVILAVGADTQPEDVSVNVKFAEPGPTAVTTPPLVTVATELLLLVQVPAPPVVDNVDVCPIQSRFEPVIATTG